jgi:hypothetical protein
VLGAVVAVVAVFVVVAVLVVSVLWDGVGVTGSLFVKYDTDKTREEL